MIRPGHRAACLVMLCLTACRIGPTTRTGAETEEMPDLAARAAEILDLQAAAWNTGDLAGFMVHYERAPTTTYIGAGGLRTGFEAIEARYAPLFEPGVERDRLRFVELRARQIDARFGIVTARYILEREGRTTGSGPFTLVLMRVEDAWKIIHDQSASDPLEEPAEDG